jgi:uncharacterized protein (TIGR03067 family)
MRMHVVLLMAVGFLVAAGPKEEAAKKDLEQMQGTWELQSMERDGTKSTAKDFKKFQRTVKGDVYTVTIEDDQGVREVTGKITLDPTQKPKAIDVKPLKGFMDDRPIQGIYRFEDDTQTLCVAPAEQKRPTGFRAEEGTLIVWKRMKK